MKRLLAIGGVLAVWAAGVPALAMPLGVRMAMCGVANARDRGGNVLSEALDAPEIAFATGGDAEWAAQGDTAHGGGSALKSGAIGDGQETWVEASVDGAGTVSFWWKASSEHYRQYVIDYAAFSVDGQECLRIGGEQDWTNATVQVEGGGTHVLRWAYVKDDEMSGGEDCAWIDEVTWVPDVASDGLAAWLAEHCMKAGDRAANGRTAAECYALGINPEDPNDDLKIIDFKMEDGKPVIKLNHTEDGSGNSFADRVKTLGKEKLTDAEWKEVPKNGNPDFRFFTIDVDMP